MKILCIQKKEEKMKSGKRREKWKEGEEKKKRIAQPFLSEREKRRKSNEDERVLKEK
jgi:hypothetical protein